MKRCVAKATRGIDRSGFDRQWRGAAENRIDAKSRGMELSGLAMAVFSIDRNGAAKLRKSMALNRNEALGRGGVLK